MKAKAINFDLRKAIGLKAVQKNRLKLMTKDQQGMRPRRVIIVDPSLVDFQGHHAEYDFAVANGLGKCGIESIILCNKNATLTSEVEYKLIPSFSKTMWEYSVQKKDSSGITKILASPFVLIFGILKIVKKWTPEIIWNISLWKHFLPRGLRINLIRRGDLELFQRTILILSLFLSEKISRNIFQKENLKAFRNVGLRKNDLVFFHMVVGPIFLAVLVCSYVAFKNTSVPPVILLRYPPSFFQRGKILLRLSWIIAEYLSEIGAIRLASDSHRLVTEFSEISNAPLEMFPIPHGRKPIRRSTQNTKVIRVGYLGDARGEKGFNTMVQVALKFKENKGQNIRFCLQAYSPDLKAQPAWEELLKNQKNSPHIEVKDNALSAVEYQKFLTSLDVVVALYDKDIYRARTSGVCLDAWSAGKVVITTRNTWSEDWAEICGLPAVFCEKQCPVELTEAIGKAIEHKDKAISKTFLEFHDEKSFANHLLKRKISSIVESKCLIVYPWGDNCKPNSGAGMVNLLIKKLCEKSFKKLNYFSENVPTSEDHKGIFGFPRASLIRKIIAFAYCPKNPGREISARFLAKLSNSNKKYFCKELPKTECIIIHYPFFVEELNSWLSRVPATTAIIHHDLLHNKVNKKLIKEKIFEKTKNASNIVDYNFFINQDELKLFKSICKTRNNNIFHIAVPHLLIKLFKDQDCHPENRPINSSDYCVFFGSDVEENREAVRYVNIALQKARKEGLTIKFLILGEVAKFAVRKYPDLVSKPDISDQTFKEYIKKSAFCYFPVVRGTGIPIKTLEAIAYKKVVVGTPLAFRGIEKRYRHKCIEIPDPNDPPLAIFEKSVLKAKA